MENQVQITSLQVAIIEEYVDVYDEIEKHYAETETIDIESLQYLDKIKSNLDLVSLGLHLKGLLSQIKPSDIIIPKMELFKG